MSYHEIKVNSNSPYHTSVHYKCNLTSCMCALPCDQKWNSSTDTHSPPLHSFQRSLSSFFFFVAVSRVHPPRNISSTITLPLETLSPNPSPSTEPTAVTLSSLGPGPLGTSPHCCLPGTYFLCPIPPSSHPKVPPPAGTGATLRTSTTRLGFVLACTADSCWYLGYWWISRWGFRPNDAVNTRVCVCRSISLSGWMLALRKMHTGVQKCVCFFVIFFYAPASVCVRVYVCVCVFFWTVLSAFAVFPWQVVLIGWPWGEEISCLAPNQHASLIHHPLLPRSWVNVCVCARKKARERVSEGGLCVQAITHSALSAKVLLISLAKADEVWHHSTLFYL